MRKLAWEIENFENTEIFSGVIMSPAVLIMGVNGHRNAIMGYIGAL